ncbi:hypothetical protein ACEWY4_001791 [Coilia grayii]|uniref:Gypsy retrotransposon integrase-like protein 1 n=1 Tax=Coilia grayii TaxID=363190 RepID=A0ABD1KU02_9TELE
MAEFKPDVFMGEEVTRTRLVRLTKPQLVQLVDFMEFQRDEDTTKAKLIDCLALQLGLADDQTKALREEQKAARERELEEQRARQKEKEKELELQIVSAKLEKTMRENQDSQRQREHEGRFDVSRCLKIMPRFCSESPEMFFEAFERLATERAWPKAEWVTLVRRELTGKAQEAYIAMDFTDSGEYNAVKKAVLRAYERVPEAYRLEFRSLRIQSGQTYVDVARQQELAFDKWLRACDVNTFQDLKQLLLVEQFKASVPRDIELHLTQQQVTEARRAAEMADNYVLVHNEPWKTKSSAEGKRQVHEVKKEVDVPHQPKGNYNTRTGFNVKSSRPVSRFGEVVCHFCHKPGHIKSRCRQLLARRGRHDNAEQPVGCVMAKGPCLLANSDELLSETPVGVCAEVYKAFTSQATIAHSESEPEVSVTVLRDTGAAQSLLLSGLISLTDETSLNASVLLKGLGGEYGAVPLHKIFLRSNLVNGYVTVGVVPSLPIDGVGLLLGNDLAGDLVSVTPIVSSVPCESPEMVVLEEQCPDVFPACVVTRSQSKKGVEDKEVEREPVDLSDTFFATLSELPDCQQYTREALIAGQKSDTGLMLIRKTAVSSEESQVMAEGFYMRDDVLMRKWRPSDRPATEVWSVVEQIVLPRSFRSEVLRLAHEAPMAGHLGIRRTQAKILQHFYWPKLHRDVVSFCRSCHACQVVGKPNQKIPLAPLRPLPVTEEPFSRVLIDCVGPLPKTKKGHQYLLTIMDMTTRFPEAVPLRVIKAKPVLDALITFFSRFGLPKQIQSDRGTNFVSNVFQDVMCELGIQQITSSAYHPQSQGAIERYHQTLKRAIKTYALQHPGDWDVALPFMLFALRDSVNESTGFTPFELVFGHEVRGPLKLIKERLIKQPFEGGVLQYVALFRDRLSSACQVARDNLKGAQERMKVQYDKKAVERTFKPGDRVLVLMPMRGNSLSTRFCGPYIVKQRVGDRNYIIDTPDRRAQTRLCHINLLKAYVGREPATVLVSCVSVSDQPDVDGTECVEPVSMHVSNSDALHSLSTSLSYLSESQQADIRALVEEFPDLFRDRPGRTNLAIHDVDTGDALPIKQQPYRVGPTKLKKVQEEVDCMLQLGIVQPSYSEWSSPVVLVPKPDGSVRFCIDYRKVNQVTRTDAFPIPRLEDCIDRIGRAQYVSKLDLLKGYWQVPLTPRAQLVSAFVTPDGLYQCQVLPFGMKNAPATFQRAMNTVIAGLGNVVTYIDDLVCFSDSWSQHMSHLRQLFQRLRHAQLVVNLPKCELGRGQVTYLGHQVGQGLVFPRQAKIQAILNLPVPRTRRELMRVLGMCGFYRRFVKNFAAITEPLTSLLRKDIKFKWSSSCQAAFEQLKAILSCEPVLRAPKFDIPFKLAVDACDVGIGAVLLQSDEQGLDRPVAYFSKKLNQHQRAYSTIEKEALALVLAVRHFEIYVSSGGEVLVLTDHNPLTFIAKFKSSNARVFRWSLVLQPYNLVVQHVAGKDNVIADTLSRA